VGKGKSKPSSISKPWAEERRRRKRIRIEVFILDSKPANPIKNKPKARSKDPLLGIAEGNEQDRSVSVAHRQVNQPQLCLRGNGISDIAQKGSMIVLVRA